MNTIVFLARHAKTTADDIYLGKRIDSGLSAEGFQQALLLAERMEFEGVSALFSSTLRRSIQTAEVTARRLGIAFEKKKDFDELDFGELTGKNLSEAENEYAGLAEQWSAGRYEVPWPGGESPRQAMDRAILVLQKIVEKNSGKAIGVVGHSQLNRCILFGLGLVKGNWRFVQAPACVNIIEFASGKARRAVLNDCSHLESK